MLSPLISELSQWQTSFINAKQVIQTSWEDDTSLFIIPGGRDVPYHQALKGEGNRRIKQFIENGGSFLGICAGAYYGCRTIEFDKGMKLEVLGERELAFFPGTARGPAYGLGTFHYHSEEGAKASLISDNFLNTTFRSYYNGGCYFADVEKYSQITVLSKYLELENFPAAIIKTFVGKGKVILSGVHFEISPFYQPFLLNQKMQQELIPHEKQRKRFVEKLFHSLLKIQKRSE